MSDEQPTLGEMFKGLNPRQTIEYTELVDAARLEGMPEFAIPLMLTGTSSDVIEKLDARLSDTLKFSIQVGVVKPGIARRLAKLSDEELKRAEQALMDNAKLTGEDLDNLRQVTRQEAVQPLAALFDENPAEEVRTAFAALVKRYAAHLDIGEFERLFEKAIQDNHPQVGQADDNDGDVLGQILAEEPTELVIEKEYDPLFLWFSPEEFEKEMA